MQKINTGKYISLWVWYLLTVVSLCIIVDMIHPPFIFSDNYALVIGFIYITVEAFILISALGILHKIDILNSLKIIVYHGIIIISSFAINFLFSPVGSRDFNKYAFFIFILLISINIALSKIFFEIKIWKSCLFGFFMGIINALMIIFTSTYHK